MTYEMPETLSELSAMLHHKDDTVFLCAGTTDLMLHLRQKSYGDFGLIDLTHIEEMRKISIEDQVLHLGAAVTMSELEYHPLLVQTVPALARAAAMVGSEQIRNLATLGGNVANASQSADTLPVLLAYQAEAVLMNEKDERRVVSVEELIIGLGRHKIGAREVIVEFLIPCEAAFSSFAKVGSRKSVTISKLNGCLKADIIDQKFREVKLYLGAIGPKAVEAVCVKQVLEGASPFHIEDSALKEAVYQEIEDKIGNRASKHYKKSAAFGIVLELIDGFKVRMG